MSYLFSNDLNKGYGLHAFNGNINDWDVSSVTDMSYMFEMAASLNQDISGWNVSSVTTMSCMFAGAKAFNQSLNQWKVSSVTSLAYMFYNAFSFNQDLNDWDEHLRNADGTYRNVNTQDMFKGSKREGNPPAWYASI